MTTTDHLITLLRERHDKGLAKYGTTVDRTDLTHAQWCQHAIEELLDGAAYLMRVKEGRKWQPIETAPKAQVKCLGCDRLTGDVSIMYWSMRKRYWVGIGGGMRFYPTHWAEIPALDFEGEAK